MNAIDSSYDSKTDFELIDELEKLSGVKVPQAIEDTEVQQFFMILYAKRKYVQRSEKGSEH